jgi:hypothetical protein
MTKIKEYSFLSLNSIKKKLNPFDRKYCFELLGYDYIIDENFQVWLIEINNNPSIDETTPRLSVLIHRMLDDAFKLTIDVLFPKK